MSDQGGACGTREPGGVIRLKVSGEAKGEGSQGGDDASTGHGGVLGSKARCRARGSSGLGGACDRQHQIGSTHLDAGDEEGLKGTRGGEAEELGVRGGRRGRLGGIT